MWNTPRICYSLQFDNFRLTGTSIVIVVIVVIVLCVAIRGIGPSYAKLALQFLYRSNQLLFINKRGEKGFKILGIVANKQVNMQTLC